MGSLVPEVVSFTEAYPVVAVLILAALASAVGGAVFHGATKLFMLIAGAFLVVGLVLWLLSLVHIDTTFEAVASSAQALGSLAIDRANRALLPWVSALGQG